MKTYLKNLAIANYRGIGPNRQELIGLSPMNLFIGPNNSGKSAFLSFIASRLNQHKWNRTANLKVEDLDRHHGNSTLPITYSLGASIEDLKAELFNIIERKKPNAANSAVISSVITALTQTDTFWIEHEIKRDAPQQKEFEVEKIENFHLHRDNIRYYWHVITGKSGGDAIRHWIPEIAAILGSSAIFKIPEVAFIPAIRDVGKAGDEFIDCSGRGLINQLASIQNPAYQNRENKKLFTEINGFLKIVTGDQTANLEIPHDLSSIHVNMGDVVMPLTSLGTGIAELIMIASFCTLNHDQIVCIEEPEIHLHPLLQRRLVKYLTENTSNQYFIATHSAALIDAAEANVYHVKMSEGQTVISSAVTSQERFAICNDLGYKASDIIQANSIIWVEGPSDRIYLNHWIKEIDSSLVEGLHYSIMFYGGKLLSHLSTDEEIVNEFINLRSLNRHIAVVIDSDRKNGRSSINQTKKRITQSFESGSGIGWLTKGREIENYVAPELIEEAIKMIYGSSFQKVLGKGQYDHLLEFKRLGRTKSSDKVVTADKVKVARYIAEQPANLNILDLRSRIQDLVNMITEANKT